MGEAHRPEVDPKPPMTRDLRKYAANTNVHLAFGALLLLAVVGVGLIWLIYGAAAASLGLMCVLAGASPILLIGLVLLILDWIMNRAGRG